LEKWGTLGYLILKILITGGLGLIGGRLGSFLSERGHLVTLATRGSSHEFQKNFSSNGLINIRTIDWNDSNKIESLCASHELVIHAAGMNANECLLDPKVSASSAIFNATQLLKASKNSNVQKFIYLSSAHVYSSSLEGLINEDTPALNEHPYAKAHLAAENQIINGESDGAMQSIVLRLSNCFGYPVFKNNNAWSLVANDLCMQAVNNKKLIIKSNRFVQRDFLPIDLFCNTLNCLMDRKTFFSDKSKIINFGSGVSMSILSLAQKIQQMSEEIIGRSPEIVFIDKDIKEPRFNLEYRSKFLEIQKNKFNEAFCQEIKKLFNHCI
jgi:UDP-glucose 4-epimerase